MFFITSLGSDANALFAGLPPSTRMCNPELSKSLRVSIGLSYLIWISDESNVDLYAMVMILPKKIHLRIKSFLIWNPSL